MNFLVLSRVEIERFKLYSPHVTISICEPGLPPAAIPGIPAEGSTEYTTGLRAVLRLFFSDVKRESKKAKPISEPQAMKIAQFAYVWGGKVPLIVCQCDIGISRSAAVAAALSKWMNGTCDWAFLHFSPNRFVYDRVLSACQMVRSMSVEEGNNGF